MKIKDRKNREKSKSNTAEYKNHSDWETQEGMIFSFIGCYSPANQMLRLKEFAEPSTTRFANCLRRHRILLRKIDCLPLKCRKMNMPALRSHSFVLARFTFRFVGSCSPSDQMLRICRTSCSLSAGEAPQNEYARFAVAFIYACALQIPQFADDF